jgi:small conductance mechanosensitive channel
VRYVIPIFVIIDVLRKFDVQTASIIALLGTVGLDVGLALRGTLSHFAAGVVLLIFRPFKISEFIEAGGKMGAVEEIGLFATKLKTADGIIIYVLNGQLLGATMRNFSRNPTRRINITVGVSCSDDIPKSLPVAKALMDADDRVLKAAAPQTKVMSLGDSSVNTHMRCWGNSADYWNIFFDQNKGIKERYDAEGISITFSQRDIHIVEHKKD